MSYKKSNKVTLRRVSGIGIRPVSNTGAREGVGVRNPHPPPKTSLRQDIKWLVKEWRQIAADTKDSEASIFRLCADDLEFVLNRTRGSVGKSASFTSRRPQVRTLPSPDKNRARGSVG
jgi:hypothetical protein